MASIALERVVRAAEAVAATSSRKEKGETLAAVLRECEPADLPIVVGLLTGEPRQGRIGVGWSSVRDVAVAHAFEPSLTAAEVDAVLTELASTHGSGSRARRHEKLAGLLGRATAAEDHFVRQILTGGLRQGALEGVMVDAIAKASSVPATLVRRANMLSGDLGEVAVAAATGGREALAAIGLRVLRAVKPMLASTAASAAEAVTEIGEVVVQTKLDGIRIQAHRADDVVKLYTRNLNDVTGRLPGVVSVVSKLDCSAVVLDGEVVGVFEDSPEMFQDTASTFSSGGSSDRVELDVQFFDMLHLDGTDLIDEPLSARLETLTALAGDHTIDSVVTDDARVAEAFAADAIDRGHEGVVVKAIDSPYAAGRRGKAWRKVKPVHTFDLVVLGAEWGHGRRTGWLSNLHLGARDGDDFVMVGKTFKGLTDELLTWQTEALLELERERRGIAVLVRPELVVEIALDGVQRSTTYDGGLALRFARVKGYRPDKSPSEADTLDDLRALFR